MFVDIQNMCEAKIPTAEQFTTWAKAALTNPDQETFEVCIRIVDNHESAHLNKTYRHKEGPTNILSFPADLPEDISEEMQLLGDLVICAPLVEQEAHAQEKTSEMHWAHLVVHGMLHLQGHDHEEEDEAVIMETLEINIMAALNFPNPYGESTKHG